MASSSLVRPPPHNNLVVRTLLSVTPEERTKILEDVDYNIFAFPIIFGEKHGFNMQMVGCSFLGIGLGLLFGTFSQPYWNR